MSVRETRQGKFRLAVLVALIPIIIGYAYYLTRPREQPVPEASAEVVQTQVLADGSVLIDGTAYSDPGILKAHWTALRERHPDLSANVQTSKGISPEALGKAIALFQAAGIDRVTFVTGPLPSKGPP